MKSVVITGATSMIGASLVHSLVANNAAEHIYAVVRKGCTKLSRLPVSKRIVTVECDIEEYAKLPSLIQDSCDVFYHLAWLVTGGREFRSTAIIEQEKNIRFALEALFAAKVLHCSKFIGAGSQAEYGPLNLPCIAPDSPTNPVEAYGVAKLAAGKLVRMQAKLWGMNCLWVRIFSVYGKFDAPSTLISSTIQKILCGERPAFTKGVQRWDYLYDYDAGNAFRLIGEKAEGNKVYCLGSGQAKPLREYIEQIRDFINPDIPLGFGEIPYPENPVMNLCADISSLKSDTGWRPRISFEDGIKEIIDWKRCINSNKGGGILWDLKK